MNFLCPSCRTPLPREQAVGLVTCTQCSVQVDLTRVDTAPGQARLWPEVDLKGETLSGHKLLSRLGSGGMGTVYEAESPVGAPVAMKVLSPMLAAEPALRERFRREARSLTTVKHPRVVQLFEEGEDRGFCWYSMELVKGLDLRHRLEKGVMSPADVRALAVSLLEALAAVHEAGVVHRDVKPANILLGPEGPRLCDFGIAQVAGATTLTESAALLGSLRYMAPEQRWGKADDRSDLYALGVVLHECLSGGVPGEAPLPGSTPASLVKFIERLTAQSPSARPVSATEAQRLLVSFEKGTRQKLIIGGAAAALLVIVGIVAAVVSGEDTPKAVTPAAPPPPVEVAVVDAGAPEPADAGQPLVIADSLDVEIPEAPPTGLLSVRTVGATSYLLDGVPQKLSKTPVPVTIGTHEILVVCPGGGKKGSDTSPILRATVTTGETAEVTWNCNSRNAALVAAAPKPVKKPLAKPPPVKGLGVKAPAVKAPVKSKKPVP